MTYDDETIKGTIWPGGRHMEHSNRHIFVLTASLVCHGTLWK